MWAIAESITVGVIVRLINNYRITKYMFENCMHEKEEEDADMVSVSTSISDLSGVSGNHHVHV